MKKFFLSIFLFLSFTSYNYSKVYIIVYDCSGSFIGNNAHPVLKKESINKINELLQITDFNDTIIFIPIRENSTISSLNQIILTRKPKKKVYDKQTDHLNNQRVSAFVKAVLNEINKPAAKSTDIIAAINFAGSIAKQTKDAVIMVLSDGDDNINSKMFNNLSGLTVYHLFVYSKDSKKINNLLEKWRNTYSKLGVKSNVVLDAQGSITYKIIR